MMSSIHFRIYFIFNFVPICVFGRDMKVCVETRGLCPFGAGVVDIFEPPNKTELGSFVGVVGNA